MRIYVMLGIASFVSSPLSFAQTPGAPALRVHCQDDVPGNSISATLDSEVPSLGTVVLGDGASRTQFLSPQSVCGVAVDFARSCKGLVSSRPGASDFSFQCDNEISGNVGFADGEITFRCSGPGVTEAYSDAMFFFCAAY